MVPGMTVLGMRSLAQVRAELRGERGARGAAGRADVGQPADRVAGARAARGARPRRPRRRGRRALRRRGGRRRRPPPDAVRARRARARPRSPSGCPGILPDLTAEEALELTAIHSLAGRPRAGRRPDPRPPFFAPHHDASKASLLGGGTGRVRPGEISRAHCGVLFLDEFPLFRADVIDALRQPLESGEVTIARGEESATYPARGMVVMACNPCPCGEYRPRRPGNQCTCSEQQRRHYRRGVSGPIATGSTSCVTVCRPARRSRATPRATAESSVEVRARVERGTRAAARAVRRAGWRLNSQVPGRSCASGRWPTRRERGWTTSCSPVDSAGAARCGSTGWPGRWPTCAGGPPGPGRGRRGAPAAHRRAADARRPWRRAGVSEDDDRLARVALARIAEPGDPRLAGLVAQLGAVRLLDGCCGQRDLDGAAHRGREPAARRSTPSASSTRAARLGIRFVVPATPSGRRQLDDLTRAEALATAAARRSACGCTGPLRLDELAGSVAVVGSRSATTYGARGRRRARRGRGPGRLPVVSGAAFGIDQAAHRGALAARRADGRGARLRGRPRLPGGPRELLDHLAADGAVVSEVPPGCAPDPARFLGRNRLIAALTRGTVVVEAAAPQRRPQHRRLGRPPQPGADGGPGPGDQRARPGRPRADPHAVRRPW